MEVYVGYVITLPPKVHSTQSEASPQLPNLGCHSWLDLILRKKQNKKVHDKFRKNRREIQKKPAQLPNWAQSVTLDWIDSVSFAKKFFRKTPFHLQFKDLYTSFVFSV